MSYHIVFCSVDPVIIALIPSIKFNHRCLFYNHNARLLKSAMMTMECAGCRQEHVLACGSSFVCAFTFDRSAHAAQSSETARERHQRAFAFPPSLPPSLASLRRRLVVRHLFALVSSLEGKKRPVCFKHHSMDLLSHICGAVLGQHMKSLSTHSHARLATRRPRPVAGTATASPTFPRSTCENSRGISASYPRPVHSSSSCFFL